MPSSDVKSYPVIYGRKNDGLPQSIKVRGVIEKISLAPFGCGFIHLYGTAKIKLLDKVEGYKPEYVYVAATCFFTHTSKGILNKDTT